MEGRMKMRGEQFAGWIKDIGISTLTGVPDSALKPFCDYINSDGKNLFDHYVPANEGAAVGIAIGSYLATGKPACIYMQNSGIGNIVNPVTSLANRKIYGIPMLMVIGWRGEPGTGDEPQHKFMGSITEHMLKVLEIAYAIIGKNTAEDELDATGKISREVYEQSDTVKGQHAQDFLTVGGMGHASMIALEIAKKMPHKKVYCLDGDGAVFMHMGSMAFIAKQNPGNLVHICLNNEAHESVGGMPTGSAGLEYAEVARACGYPAFYTVDSLPELKMVLNRTQQENVLSFIEIKTAIQSRGDLGRPKEDAAENKNNFMRYHGVME